MRTFHTTVGLPPGAHVRPKAPSTIATRAVLARPKKLSTTANDPKARAALEDFEPRFFNNTVLVLDRLCVHRTRAVAGTATRSTRWKCCATRS